MKKIIITLALCLNCAYVQASTLPLGVQNDVLLDTVINDWGWSQIYRGDYSASGTINDIFSGHGQYIMIGAIQGSSDTIELLAATTWDDFTTYTARNAPHTSNGAEWYNNTGSLGFAGLGDAIIQNSADINQVNGALRLSWHAHQSGFGSLVSRLTAGYRAGNFTGLNNSSEWDRIIFTTNDVSAVPVPAAVWLFGTGLMGLIGVRKKTSKSSTLSA